MLHQISITKSNYLEWYTPLTSFSERRYRTIYNIGHCSQLCTHITFYGPMTTHWCVPDYHEHGEPEFSQNRANERFYWVAHMTTGETAHRLHVWGALSASPTRARLQGAGSRPVQSPRSSAHVKLLLCVCVFSSIFYSLTYFSFLTFVFIWKILNIYNNTLYIKI